jgi:hypothetical protein
MIINPKTLSMLQAARMTSPGSGDGSVDVPGFPPSLVQGTSPAAGPKGVPAPVSPRLSTAAPYGMHQHMGVAPPQLPTTHPLYNTPLSNLGIYSGPNGGSRYVTDIANRVGAPAPPSLNPAHVENHIMSTGWQPVPPTSARVGDLVGTPGTGPGERRLAIYAGNGQVIGGPGNASYAAGRQPYSPSTSAVYRPPAGAPALTPKPTVEPRVVRLVQGPGATTLLAPSIPAQGAANLPGSAMLRPAFIAPGDTNNPSYTEGTRIIQAIQRGQDQTAPGTCRILHDQSTRLAPRLSRMLRIALRTPTVRLRLSLLRRGALCRCKNLSQPSFLTMAAMARAVDIRFRRGPGSVCR